MRTIRSTPVTMASNLLSRALTTICVDEVPAPRSRTRPTTVRQRGERGGLYFNKMIDQDLAPRGLGPASLWYRERTVYALPRITTVIETTPITTVIETTPHTFSYGFTQHPHDRPVEARLAPCPVPHRLHHSVPRSAPAPAASPGRHLLV